ncbi:E3 ubiquitin-protein ligase TRIM11-like [Dendrobates tinctorius]|uniref:E3 ubiquitin-protein ligase TRIM11-like n=1 Tax=Dendrobates tinctorius TaxID=92724 RepID=UPI003CC9263E
MASAGLRKELECSICLTLYTDPVTLRCGHNFCRDCIDQVLNTQDEFGEYSCPECREKFQERPTLKKNITLCNVVENFLSTQPHQEEITGICCTYCMDSPVPAVRSCLHCEASLCDNHLRIHNKGAEHVLTDTSTSLETRKCSVHKKILEYYCTEDAACICVYCSAGEHRGHKVETLDEASEKKKTTLRNVLQNLITKKEKTEEKALSLEENFRKTKENVNERVTTLFIDIRSQVDDLEKRALSQLSRWEEQVSLSLSDVIQKLEIRKDQLSKMIKDIEELCNMTDPLTVLQKPDKGDVYGFGEWRGNDEGFGVIHGENWGKELISHISQTLSDIMTGVNLIFYDQDPTDILLDVKTANDNINISEDLTGVDYTEIKRFRYTTDERFSYHPQVLSSTTFSSGRHYWDVDIGRSDSWRVGMCYPSVNRRGYRSLFGHYDSWCLSGGSEDSNSTVMYDGCTKHLPYCISRGRVRIYLDYEAGQLSFYVLGDPIRHLHTFTATFTEPLHAALHVKEGSIKISNQKAWSKKSDWYTIYFRN